MGKTINPEFFAEQNIPCFQNELLSKHTSFKIGGAAKFFCRPQNTAQLCAVLQECKKNNIRIYFLGNGSNILFADEGFEGVVIHIAQGFDEISVHDNIVTAGAGAPLSKVCLAAGGAGLTGLEFAYGIPGCVGGAVYMNAGAYGGEIKDCLHSVSFLDENCMVRTFTAENLALGYRSSIFEAKPWCILSASFELSHDNQSEIRARMDDFARRRTEKQPLDKPSAGSTFKRPQGAFAGALIDQCGLRGYSVGGAAISEKHCGFIINQNNATCADVLQLADEVCAKVTKETGYTLEKEIRVVK